MPSFGTTGALFSRHFDILRNLKRRIVLLKQAFETQQDEERTWDQVGLILKTLEKGCQFLNFDEYRSIKGSTAGEGNEKQFYEDPSLAGDEAKLAAEMDEKRRVEDALRPMTMEMTSNNDGGALTKNNSSMIHPATETGDGAADE